MLFGLVSLIRVTSCQGANPASHVLENETLLEDSEALLHSTMKVKMMTLPDESINDGFWDSEEPVVAVFLIEHFFVQLVIQ